MSSSPGTVESPLVAGHRLRATLLRAGDRFSHFLELVATGGESFAGDTSLRVADAIDGDPRSDWPPSPPLQQVHFESRPPAARVALLVGMAGRSHWSLSIEPLADQATLLFDAACRIDRTPDLLGHAWHVAESLGDAKVEPLRATWRTDLANLTINVEPAHDGLARTELSVNDRHCAVRVIPMASRFPATIRWRFTWTVTRNSRPS